MFYYYHLNFKFFWLNFKNIFLPQISKIYVYVYFYLYFFLKWNSYEKHEIVKLFLYTKKTEEKLQA